MTELGDLPVKLGPAYVYSAVVARVVDGDTVKRQGRHPRGCRPC